MYVEALRPWIPKQHDSKKQSQTSVSLMYPAPSDSQGQPLFGRPSVDSNAHSAPYSYPPPPPPGINHSHSHSSVSYGQAPQGSPYPPITGGNTSASSSSSRASVATNLPPSTRRRDGRASPKPESFYAPHAAELYNHATMINGNNGNPNNQNTPSPGPDGSGSSTNGGGAGRDHYPSAVPRLPPILQVEKKQVTTSATQAASASRRRNEAHFVCPVPGCGSTFTRRFNLRGHLRSHTEERPYICDWPGCQKGFARQHDCKRHQALHSNKSQSNICPGCKKTFSRLDALNRHLRSEGGSECRHIAESKAAEAISSGDAPGPSKKRKIEEGEDWESRSDRA